MNEKTKKDDWLEKLDPTFSTKGFKKLWNYFLEVIKKEYFQNKIKSLREQYQIPSEGFKHGDSYEFPPEEWKLKEKKSGYRDLQKELEELCNRYDLSHPEWREVIEHYLFYNEFCLAYSPNSYNLCEISVIENNPLYPVAIKISPYATTRDITNYVTKMRLVIGKLQKQYQKQRTRIGKARSKQPSVEERNEFIYQNRRLPRRKIKELISNRFKTDLDYEYIGKIISEENKKRKEV